MPALNELHIAHSAHAFGLGPRYLVPVLQVQSACDFRRPAARAGRFWIHARSPILCRSTWRAPRRAGRVAVVTGQPLAGLAAGVPIAWPADGDVHALRHTHSSALIAQEARRGSDFPPAWPLLAGHHVAHLRPSVQYGGQRRGRRDRERLSQAGRPVMRYSRGHIRGQFPVCFRSVLTRHSLSH